MVDVDYAKHFAVQAQNWHETDHGLRRGKPLRRNRFTEPVVDEPLPEIPESFRECVLCQPGPDVQEHERSNPFWSRVVAWENG